MSEELMLKVDNLYKKYRLGVIGGGTLTADLQSWWARVRHKEDPNQKIGEETHEKNETFYALKGISFEVKKGEALGIIGGNGAGKSTTLKILSQVTAPTEGTIYMNGRVASMLEVGTGFHPELTGRENVYLNGAILGMTKAEIDRKMDEIIEFSECGQFIDTPVKRYSSGMYVKLAFSVAAHLDSEIMIMDEVLAVGDMKFQKKCIDKMVDISRNEGRTILYVSHNMSTIRNLCNRCIVLEHGELVFEGDVEKSIEKYMGANEIICEDSIDFDNAERDPRSKLEVKIRHLDCLQKNCSLKGDDELKVKLKMACAESIEDVLLRTIIYTSDERVIGMTVTEQTMDFKEGEEYDKTFNLKVKNLAPGNYRAQLELFKTTKFGTLEFMDILSFYFNVPEYENKFDVEWVHSWWGNISFGNTEILD